MKPAEMPAGIAIPAKRTESVVPFRRMNARREELAFLPAALEIVETPPSPIGRTIGATIILLFCAALAWAWWGTIDIVAAATGKNRAERSHQGHPAVRDRGGALHPGAGRAGGQGRRRADRTRSDRQRGGTRSSAQRPPRRAAQHRAAARGTWRRGRSRGRLHAARRCGPVADQHPAPASAQSGDRTSRQDRRALPTAGAEGSRAGYDRGQHP